LNLNQGTAGALQDLERRSQAGDHGRGLRGPPLRRNGPGTRRPGAKLQERTARADGRDRLKFFGHLFIFSTYYMF
jgi:hypothetical protein